MGEEFVLFFAPARRNISAMLFAVRNSLLRLTFFLAMSAAALGVWAGIPFGSGFLRAQQLEAGQTSPASLATQSSTPPGSGQTTVSPSPNATQQPAVPQSTSPQMPPAAPAYSGPIIVIDPAHGGTDSGARGGTGVLEKDVVLAFAKTLRTEIERQGYRAVLTRSDDSNPSYDDRAAMANGYRDVIFISLHVASTGTVGTARAYYYQFPAPMAATAPTGSDVQSPATPVPTLLSWDEAQRSYADTSHRFADAVQTQFAQNFSGSPSAATAAAVGVLRHVAAPAVAVEVSSVSVENASALVSLSGSLANSITRALAGFRPVNSAGTR
jgi:N-acetylmuramoyl-L-alanine amidase